jgi:hypothetical protein
MAEETTNDQTNMNTITTTTDETSGNIDILLDD